MAHFGAHTCRALTLAHTNKPNQNMLVCKGKHKHTHTDMHTTHTCTCKHRSVFHCYTYLEVKEGKNPHLKTLIRIWTVTRLVHKLGEIWVGITIWQLAVRHQTSSVISIFSLDSELCDNNTMRLLNQSARLQEMWQSRRWMSLSFRKK